MCFNITNYYRSSQRYRTEVKRVTYMGQSKHRHNLVYIIMSTRREEERRWEKRKERRRRESQKHRATEI